MSYTSSAYPPARRSRSRSPYHGNHLSRPPHQDSYPPEGYRADWEAYDRDKAWGYDRDKNGYEYNRRGRSRSPGPDDGSRKRSRSPSPYERDRYDPRPRYADDYDAHSRSHGYQSPRRGGYPSSSRRAPPDPHTMDYPATLKQYADWFRYFYPQQAIDEDNADKAAEQEAGDGSKPRNGIKTKWEKYKKEFSAAQMQTMFDHHRKSPWFAEKYDPNPEFVYLRKRVRKEGWKGKLAAFLVNLEAGQFDPGLNEPASETSSLAKDSVKTDDVSIKRDDEKMDVVKIEAVGDLKDEGDANGGMAPGDESVKLEDDLDAEDDTMDKAEPNGKAVDENRRFNRAEEMSIDTEGNQVMIRTLPPDIGRIKLEQALKHIPGFMYIALTDPMQKKNFYRSAWIRFRDDADMSAVMSEMGDKKIEGFKLHTIHVTTPLRSKIRTTPEAVSRPDRVEKDLANIKVLANILETEYLNVRRLPEKPNDAPADWEKTQIESDILLEEVNDPEDPEPKERGTDAVERRIEKLVDELKSSGRIPTDSEKEFNYKKALISLDLYLAYLRAAFHTCYYCALVADHLEEFQRKCIHHTRTPLSKAALEEIRVAEAEKEQKAQTDDGEGKEKRGKDGTLREGRDWKRADERWLENMDSKIALLINRDEVDPKSYGAKNYEEELSKVAEPHVKQEDEGKFRCKTCQKLFKAMSFVEKHIANKHSELVKSLDEIPYFNNFALDPNHILPFSHPPQNSGNQQPPPQAYGLPGPAPYAPPPDYGRGPPFYPAPYAYAAPPPAFPNPGYWDPYAYAQYAQPPYPAVRDSGSGKRLSDRISGFAPGFDQSMEPLAVPASAGLPPKPVASGLDTALPDDHRGRKGGGRRNGGRGGDGGVQPPPPPDAKEDPRAAAGKKVSYHDMDLVAEGDVELQY
ncbi:hypothetical protein OF83DRAFT_1165659 [Amylostereum chailletii]|nr:hypothetical protein OF83DRAFT_1165659 [Amylostereum chailletii]